MEEKIAMDSGNTATDVALNYLGAGLCVLPADPKTKRPTLSRFKPYRQSPPSQHQLKHWFADHEHMCVLTGKASGNLEVIDFDHGGQAFEPWCKIIQAQAPELLARLVVEETQSGGRHVIYRCQSEVPGSTVLARLKVEAPSAEPISIGGKSLKPRCEGEKYFAYPLLIETRGEGGLFVCAPTQGYKLCAGSLTQLPVLDEPSRQLLIDAARSLSEEPCAADSHAAVQRSFCSSHLPGDRFNETADLGALLEQHGWHRTRGGENEHWCRPGKKHGCSATLKGGTFYVFTSNAPPFQPSQSYSPFAVYAMLEHGGDYSQAAKALSEQGYGDTSTVDLSGILTQVSAKSVEDDDEPSMPTPEDPGVLPERLLRCPGFIAEVMDHCLDTAPYPNPTMAFCGALSLQATLAGRRVRDPGDNRTNLYLLGLAHSAAGKDWPRKLNMQIMQHAGITDCVGERFASGEGIQDSLFLTPTMLYQTDEIDGLLQSINKARDARHEQLMSTLLTMYSSSNSVYPMRRKAGKEAAGSINQPNLVVFGTAIPNHYYAALSERMLTNGLFARMLIFECGRRGKGQEPKIREIPETILQTAKWWESFRPGTGNLADWNPVPAIVTQNKDARELLSSARLAAESEYDSAEANNDAIGTTVWGRVSEQTRKLALIHAISRDCRDPIIDGRSARWAIEVVEHQTRRMLFMAASNVAENPFHADCLRVIEKLRKEPDHMLPHSKLLKRMKMEAKVFHQLIETLMQQGDINIVTVSTAGRPQRKYQLTTQVTGKLAGEAKG